MAELAQQQQQVRHAAELLAQQQATGQPTPMDQAAQDLAHVANELNNAQAENQQEIPPSAEAAMEQAQEQLQDAAQQAEAANPEAAQANAEQAQQALAMAQAMLAMAQQAEAGEPEPGEHPGEPHSGPPHPGSHPGSHPGQMSPSPTPHRGNENHMGQALGHREGMGNNTTDQGARGDQTGGSAYVGLPSRDRAAIQESHNNKYPEEYGPMIEQYLKNLSDEANDQGGQ